MCVAPITVETLTDDLRRLGVRVGDEHGIVDWPGEDYFVTILREYLATGRARPGRVGLAQSELIEASDLVDFGTQWMNLQFRNAGA